MRSIAHFFFSALCPLFHGIASVCVVGERGGGGGRMEGWPVKREIKMANQNQLQNGLASAYFPTYLKNLSEGSADS